MKSPGLQCTIVSFLKLTVTFFFNVILMEPYLYSLNLNENTSKPNESFCLNKKLLEYVYQVNGARSLKTLTPYFSHSTASIHNSWAVSRQDIMHAPFHATIEGSMSLGLVIMSSCSARYKYGIWRDILFWSHVPESK